MIDPFVILAPVLLLAVVALVRFVGCATILDLQPITYASALRINSLEPDHATACSSNVTLTVNGTGFVKGTDSVSGSVVHWNSSPLLNTQFISDTQLTVIIDSVPK